jgi:hypothetical protein
MQKKSFIKSLISRPIVFALTFSAGLILTLPFVRNTAIKTPIKAPPVISTYEVEIFEPLELSKPKEKKRSANEPVSCPLDPPQLRLYFYLPIEVNERREIKLNKENLGDLSDTSRLESYLLDTFREREAAGFKRINGNRDETEKTVIVTASSQLKYEDVMKLIKVLNRVGASPIKLNLEGCYVRMADKCLIADNESLNESLRQR